MTAAQENACSLRSEWVFFFSASVTRGFPCRFLGGVWRGPCVDKALPFRAGGQPSGPVGWCSWPLSRAGPGLVEWPWTWRSMPDPWAQISALPLLSWVTTSGGSRPLGGTRQTLQWLSWCEGREPLQRRAGRRPRGRSGVGPKEPDGPGKNTGRTSSAVTYSPSCSPACCHLFLPPFPSGVTPPFTDGETEVQGERGQCGSVVEQ